MTGELVVAAAVPVVIGLVGYGVLRNRVETAHQRLGEKADRDVVEVQYQAILRELQQINARIGRLET